MELVRSSSVDSTGKELMGSSGFCDGTRGSQVEYDYDTSVGNNVGYLDLLDERSGEGGNIHKKDVQLHSLGDCALNLPNTETVYFRLIT